MRLGDYRKVEKIARISSVGNKVVLALLVALGFYFGSSAIDLLNAKNNTFLFLGISLRALTIVVLLPLPATALIFILSFVLLNAS